MSTPQLRRTYGRLGKAPCGHDGEAIVGHFYNCLVGCGLAKPEPPKPAFTKPGFPRHIESCDCANCKIARELDHIIVYEQVTLGGYAPYRTIPWCATDGPRRIVAVSIRRAVIVAITLHDSVGSLLWPTKLPFVSGVNLNSDPNAVACYPALKLHLEPVNHGGVVYDGYQLVTSGCP